MFAAVVCGLVETYILALCMSAYMGEYIPDLFFFSTLYLAIRAQLVFLGRIMMRLRGE
jgi:hypothetical protein